MEGTADRAVAEEPATTMLCIDGQPPVELPAVGAAGQEHVKSFQAGNRCNQFLERSGAELRLGGVADAGHNNLLAYVGAASQQVDESAAGVFVQRPVHVGRDEEE